MKKDIKNVLDEKMQVKLPETLNKENILSELDNAKTNITPMPKKKNTAKKVLPIAASFMVVVGLVVFVVGVLVSLPLPLRQAAREIVRTNARVINPNFLIFILL